MKRKHVGKKWLSVTLVLALVLGMFGSYIGEGSQVAKAAGTGDTKVLEEELAGYQRITVSDFKQSGSSIGAAWLNMTNGTNTAYKNDGYLGKNYLDIDVKFDGVPKYGVTFLRYMNNRASGKTSYNVFLLSAYQGVVYFGYVDENGKTNSAIQNVTVNAKKYKIEDTSDYFNVKLLTNITMDSDDATKATIEYQLYLNNIFATQGSFSETYVTNRAGIRAQVNEGTVGTLSVKTPMNLEKEFAGYERVSLNEYMNNTAGDGKYTTYNVISQKEEGTLVNTDRKATYKGSTDRVLTNADGYSLDKTYMSLDLNTNNGTNINHYFFNGNANIQDRLTMNWTKDSNIITLTQYKNKLAVSGAVLTCDLSKYGRENSTDFFNSKLRVDAVSNSSDAGKVDVTVQWWINDTYVGTLVCEETQMTNMYREGYQSASNPYYVREPISLEEELNGYDRLTVEDFGGLGAARAAEGTVYASNKAGVYTGTGTFDKKYLDIDIKPYQNASANRNFLNYMMTPKKNDDGTYNAWGDNNIRYQFEIEKDGTVLDLLYVLGGKGNTRIKFNLTGSGYVDDEMLNLKIRTDIDTDSTNTKRYITFQIWVNDTCVGYAHFTESQERDMTGMGIRGESAAQATIVRIPMNRVVLKDVSYDLNQGGYLLSGADTFMVNGEEKTAGTILDTAGTYTIERIMDGKVATVQRVTLTSDAQDGSDVMPIGGYYGPYGDKLTDAVFKMIADSGVNLITYSPIDRVDDVNRLQQGLALAEKYGIGMYVSDRSLNTIETDEDEDGNVNVTGHTTLTAPAEIAQQIAAYSLYDSFLGINIVDEPKPSTDTTARSYKYYTDIAKALKSYVNVTGYMNLYGSAGMAGKGLYQSYLNEIVPDVKMLSFDNYPFHANLPEPGQISDAQKVRISTYLESLDTVRQTAKDNHIPFMSFVQAGTDYRDNQSTGETKQTLTKEQTQWMANTSLAWGAKGITWFPLVQPEYYSYIDQEAGTYDYNRNGIIGADGQKNQYYNMVQEVNRQIAAIDEVLMKSENTGVIVTGSANEAVQLAASSGATEQKRGHQFTGILTQENGAYTDRLKEVSAGANAMIGCFDYQDTEAFYVVNYNYDNEAASQTITLTLNGNYKYRMIQDAETTYGEGGEVSLTIPSGAGVLVVLEDYVKEYTPAEFAACRTGETFTAPDAPEGFVFAGWFMDEECTQAVDASTKTVSQSVYAKFVDETLLDVKAQISAGTTAASENTNIRFVSAVDTLDYQKVGFVIEQEGMEPRDRSSRIVYATLSVYYEGDSQSFTPDKIFCGNATRFKTYTLSGVPNVKFGVPFEVTAYWVTLDGTRVEGPKTSKVISSVLQ